MSTTDPQPKILVNKLTKRFGDLTVLNDICFDIKAGELVAIVGPTGCGKTTFLNTLSKLMPATSGQILIDGVDYRQRSQLRGHLGQCLFHRRGIGRQQAHSSVPA